MMNETLKVYHTLTRIIQRPLSTFADSRRELNFALQTQMPTQGLDVTSVYVMSTGKQHMAYLANRSADRQRAHWYSKWPTSHRNDQKDTKNNNTSATYSVLHYIDIELKLRHRLGKISMYNDENDDEIEQTLSEINIYLGTHKKNTIDHANVMWSYLKTMRWHQLKKKTF